MENITLIGPTGSGKTSFCTDMYPSDKDLYVVPDKKSGLTYWDGYDQHHAILIDEMGGDRFAYRFLLRLLDRYSMTAPVHGGQIPFTSKVIFMTSNTHPKDWYPGVKVNSPWKKSPLRRRMREHNNSRIIFKEPKDSEDESSSEQICIPSQYVTKDYNDLALPVIVAEEDVSSEEFFGQRHLDAVEKAHQEKVQHRQKRQREFEEESLDESYTSYRVPSYHRARAKYIKQKSKFFKVINAPLGTTARILEK